MLAIDARSITFLSGVLGATLGLVLYGMGRSYPPSIRGIRHWVVAPFLCFAATLVYGLDGVLPALLVVVLGNGLLLCGTAAFYMGSQCFYGQTPAYRRWAGLIGAGLAVLVWFHEGYPDYRIRVAVFTALMAGACLVHSRLLRQHGKGLAARFMARVLDLQALMLLLRCGLAWLDAAQQNRFDPSWLQSVYFASFSLSVTLVCVGVVLLVSERLREEFEYIATYDTLTGVLTRKAVLACAQDEVVRSVRYGHGMALMMFDIDHFKAVNDTHGHLAGDRVLQKFARTIAAQLRETDRFGRFGGEEFVVVLPETALDEALQLAQRVRQAVQADAGPPPITVSIGVTPWQGEGDTVDAMLARADQALYAAKRAGRNRVQHG